MKVIKIFSWSVLMFFASCKFLSKEAGNDEEHSDYMAAEIYCFCLSEFNPNSQSFYNDCSTPALVHAHTLITPDRLFYSTKDSIILKKLTTIFFDRREKKDIITQASDARFVVLLKKSASSSDTLVYNRQNSFNFNEKYRFSYSFQIMDSIKSIIDKKTLTCP